VTQIRNCVTAFSAITNDLPPPWRIACISSRY